MDRQAPPLVAPTGAFIAGDPRGATRARPTAYGLPRRKITHTPQHPPARRGPNLTGDL